MGQRKGIVHATALATHRMACTTIGGQCTDMVEVVKPAGRVTSPRPLLGPHEKEPDCAEPIGKIEAEWARFGTLATCLRRKPPSEEERHDQVWQEWLGKAIEEIEQKVAAPAKGFIKGSW